MQMTMTPQPGNAYQSMLGQLRQVASAATGALTLPQMAPAGLPVPGPVAIPAAATVPVHAPVAVLPSGGMQSAGYIGDLKAAYNNLITKLADFTKKLFKKEAEPAPTAPAEPPKAEPAPAKPEPAPAPAPAPAPTYTVQKGDSLSAIAGRTLGDSNRWREIYDLNKDAIGGNPNLIHPGLTLKLPGGANAAPAPAPAPKPAPAPAPAAGPTYTVRSGDSLSAIAGRTLGNSDRWREIYDLNKDVIGGNPNHISVGMNLRLPSGANASAPAPSKPSGGKWQWPTSGSKTSNYGMRKHPISGQHKMHTGLDIGAATGTAVHTVQGGRVSFAGWNGGYGNYVVVDHGNGLQTAYAHLSKINVSKGQNVGARDVIGKVGSTGNSTGPHLHFEVKKNGNFVDPHAYLA